MHAPRSEDAAQHSASSLGTQHRACFARDRFRRGRARSSRCGPSRRKTFVLNAERITGRKPLRDEFEISTWAMARVGRKLGEARPAGALEEQRRITERLTDLLSRYDVILCATLRRARPSEIGADASDAGRAHADARSQRDAARAADGKAARRGIEQGVCVGGLHRALQSERPAGHVDTALLECARTSRLACSSRPATAAKPRCCALPRNSKRHGRGSTSVRR